MFENLGSRFITIVVILFAGGLMASCGGGSTAVNEAVDPELTESYWMLTAINDKPVENGTTAPLLFGDVNNVLGATGCSLFAGTYSIGEGNAINFQPNVSTTWTCEETLLAQEQAMLLVLSSASRYMIEGDQLSITNPDGERRGTFYRMESFVLAGTNWNLDAYNDGKGALVNLIEGTQISASFGEDGNLSGSAGCNEYNTNYEADLNEITIGPIALTQMLCSEPAGIMDQEGTYLAALEAAVTYNNLGIALNLFDSEGQILATYVNADLFEDQ